MIVVADTSPLLYLILIGDERVLPALYGRVFAPRAVISELTHPHAPKVVRDWAARSPSWLHVANPRQPIVRSARLGRGELDAIALAKELDAGALLIDDRYAREEAIRRHLSVIGTLGVLADAADAKLIDLSEAVARLRQTTFRDARQHGGDALRRARGHDDVHARSCSGIGTTSWSRRRGSDQR